MSVTITADALRDALRVGETAEETAEVTRLLAYATEAVQKYAPDAPTATANEAVVRLSGYLFDAPNTSARAGYADALRNSGAASMLSVYRVHRAGKCA